jgi:hypothetical protein
VFLETAGNSLKSLGSKGTFLLRSSYSLSEGEPSMLKMEKSWSPSVLPWKSGSFVISSARMQPVAQMSIAWLYCVMQLR